MNISFIRQVSGKPKITDLELISFGANQEIFWFDISMHHILTMEVIHGFQKLVNEELHTVAIQTIRFFLKYFQQVSIHKFKDQIELALSIFTMTQIKFDL